MCGRVDSLRPADLHAGARGRIGLFNEATVTGRGSALYTYIYTPWDTHFLLSSPNRKDTIIDSIRKSIVVLV